jgi:adenylate cyclase
MDCRNCGRTLDDDARFCPTCGLAVSLACTSCGASLDADARFCQKCGQPVGGTSRGYAGSVSSSASRERKVATLLFADIVGFTELGERLDAEVVSRLVSETFERLAAEVARYGGTLEKFAGDALNADYRVHATHEQVPVREVRATMAMQTLIYDIGVQDR